VFFVCHHPAYLALQPHEYNVRLFVFCIIPISWRVLLIELNPADFLETERFTIVGQKAVEGIERPAAVRNGPPNRISLYIARVAAAGAFGFLILIRLFDGPDR
jgi:hypothetical protein